MENSNITIVICSNRPKNIDLYGQEIIINFDFIKNSQVRFLIIFDKKSNFTNLDFKKSNKNTTYIYSKYEGLSNLRNLAIDLVDSRYILFIDDDAMVNQENVHNILLAFKDGYVAVGSRLVLPGTNKHNKWYIKENQMHYLGIHNIFVNSIWGACMAFDLDFIKKYHIKFDSSLDRIGQNFLSGGDTNFVSSIRKINQRITFLNENNVQHFVNENRFIFSIFIKRVIWQGVTEIVRKNIIGGFKKEFERNISHAQNFGQLISGAFAMMLFITGLFYGLFIIKNKKQAKKKVLFVCTGNYYRSKFAEFYFNNHPIIKKQKKFTAYSRGFWIENPKNIGSMSKFAKDELAKLGIRLPKLISTPTILSEEDFSESEIIVAVNKKEHYGFIKKHFPIWLNKPEYWDVEDIEFTEPEKALLTLRSKIDDLIDHISK